MVESSQERAKRNKYRRKKAMLKKVHKKAGIAFLCVMAALAVLAGRIAWINYNHGDAYSKAVLDHQTYTSTTIPYKRGQILTSNGNILAYSERVYNLILDPKLVLSDEKYKEPTLNALVQCFGLNRQELEQTLAVKKDSQYERLAMGLTSDEILRHLLQIQKTIRISRVCGLKIPMSENIHFQLWHVMLLVLQVRQTAVNWDWKAIMMMNFQEQMAYPTVMSMIILMCRKQPKMP